MVVLLMPIVVKVAGFLHIENAGAAKAAVNIIPIFQKYFLEPKSALVSNAGDRGLFHLESVTPFPLDIPGPGRANFFILLFHRCKQNGRLFC